MRLADRLSGKAGAAAAAGAGAAAHDLETVLARLHNEIIDRLDMAGIRQLDPEVLKGSVRELVQQLVARQHMSLSEAQLERIVVSIVDEILGLGPLEPLLTDSSVNDILVNTAANVYVERKGILEKTAIRFRDNAHLLHTINRIVGRVGRRIDEASPMVDARLPDGSRVNAVIPPLAIDGPILSIRRFGTGPVTPKELVQKGAFTHNMSQFLQCAVRAKCNILVAGGTGAGKTTLLNALSGFIPNDERIVTIEDSAELRLQQQHVVRLESRPANIEGKGEVTIRDLVKNALRMRPDRIVVGEVRASEVLDMIQAMNTGHEGSMTTVHANTAQDAAQRVMAMLGMAGSNLTEPMMLQMIARAIHLIVHLTRQTDGHRRLSTIAEVCGIERGQLRLHEVFRYDTWGVDESGRVQGDYVCAGRSALLDRFRSAGVPLHPSCLARG
jgi:pilus assembly protein CpaF